MAIEAKEGRHGSAPPNSDRRLQPGPAVRGRPDGAAGRHELLDSPADPLIPEGIERYVQHRAVVRMRVERAPDRGAAAGLIDVEEAEAVRELVPRRDPLDRGLAHGDRVRLRDKRHPRDRRPAAIGRSRGWKGGWK